MASPPPEYTLNQRLREEIESPYRKLRMNACLVAAASASLGTFIAATRILAFYTGIPDVQPLEETIPNVAINLAVVVGALVAYSNDKAGQDKKLQRIARGSQLAQLGVRLPGQPDAGKVVKLSTFRTKIRVVIVAGGKDVIARTLTSVAASTDSLRKASMVVVPVLLGDSGTVEEVMAEVDVEGTPERMSLPWRLPEWEQWLETEVEAAKEQGIDPTEKGLVFTIKKNGKIGQRSTGVPIWEATAAFFEQADGKYGMPEFGDASRDEAKAGSSTDF